MNEELVFLTFEEFGQVSNNYAENIDRAQFDAALLSVMQIFFRDLIGEERYLDLIANPNSVENQELINGNPPIFYGAKKWLIYQILLRLAMQTNLVFTRSGLETQNDVSPSAGEKQMLLDNISKQCAFYQSQIKKYLGSCKSKNNFWAFGMTSQGGRNKFPI